VARAVLAGLPLLTGGLAASSKHGCGDSDSDERGAIDEHRDLGTSCRGQHAP
jgi:hypothetical protein